MANRLYGEGPVLSLIHAPVIASGITSEVGTPVTALNLLWQVPPLPFSKGIIIRRFAAFVDNEVGTTASITVDLQTAPVIADLATILDATVDFTADATAFSEGVLITTDALSATNPNLGGTPGTPVAQGSYVGIIVIGTVHTDAAHFGRFIAQIDYTPWDEPQVAIGTV